MPPGVCGYFELVSLPQVPPQSIKSTRVKLAQAVSFFLFFELFWRGWGASERGGGEFIPFEKARQSVHPLISVSFMLSLLSLLYNSRQKQAEQTELGKKERSEEDETKGGE